MTVYIVFLGGTAADKPWSIPVALYTQRGDAVLRAEDMNRTIEEAPAVLRGLFLSDMSAWVEWRKVEV